MVWGGVGRHSQSGSARRGAGPGAGEPGPSTLGGLSFGFFGSGRCISGKRGTASLELCMESFSTACRMSRQGSAAVVKC